MARRPRAVNGAMLKTITSSSAVLEVAGFLLANYGRLVRATNRMRYEPATGFYDPFDRNRAVIVALWHGEHFLAPLLGRKGDRLTPLVSYHRDGEILARAGRHFGVTYLRGSGDNGKEFHRKKALQAFTGMLRELKSGGSVIVTADVPKISRVAGLGIVTLAKHAQCPILPVAMTTSLAIRLSNWDRTSFGLPFGRMAFARGNEIHVARDADDAALERARREVEDALNTVTGRAYALARNG
jgi:lysophospholipid acyltransferase (LPLAT)-like uncharacterized protein